ncbi:hypothetical protein F0562_012011 [Nyssa sinensis]|uniref:Uncharacterized protein n=1 Tax=Nyssa sinensis TaxID=561372 RepID=A0A5J4ZUI5_9ASTE|nr:hypothetical protein F0562_012011 [Nyssa sinensis]
MAMGPTECAAVENCWQRSRLEAESALGVPGYGSGKVVGEPWRSVKQENTVSGVVVGSFLQELSRTVGRCIFRWIWIGRTIRNPGGGELTGGAEGRAPWEQLEEKSP